MAESLLGNEGKELMKLLQIDGKGWKIDLFENENGVLHALCAKCGLVCRDAVELGCEHSDAQIFLHCNDCLNELIINNNGNCPINNHSNPIIFKNRTTRKSISKSIILCPYSIKYNQKMNKIEETNNNFEEKEGMNEELIKGCNFKGTIDNLLKNHILKCIKIYNPLFTQNIIQNKLKTENQQMNEKILTLQNQNQQILNENGILQNELKKQKQIEKMNENEIKILKKENNKLKKELIISNDKIMCLQMVQKQNNNIFNEEKKNDENYNSDGMVILWGIHGNLMKINGKRVTFNGYGKWCENTVYSNVFKKGKHKIKIKVFEKSAYCNICIGITSTTNYKNGLCFGENKDTYNYGYHSSGSKYSHNDYGVPGVSCYYSNDVITINIDVSNGIIWFYRNDKNIYKTNIKKDKYYMAICMGSGRRGNHSGSIEIV